MLKKTNMNIMLGTVIWIVCAVFFMYEFLLRTVLGTFEHPIMYDLNLSLVTFAILSSTAYQLIYGIMQIPVGIITDKFGLKKTLFLAVIVCAISVAGFGMTQSFKYAVIFRMLMGFGSAFGFICLLVAVYDWMPRKHIGLFIGLSQFIGTMGPMMAAGPLNSLSAGSSSSSWREVFYILGAVGIVIGILVLLIVKNKRTESTFRILEKPEPIKDSIYKLMRQKQVWFIAVFSACVYFAIEYLSENSGKQFLILNGISSSSASYMITIAWLGYAVGCPGLGFISDLTSRRKETMILSCILCLISMLTIMFIPNKNILFVAFFVLGLGASGQSVGFAIMAEQCSKNYLAAGLGLNNAMIMLVTSINAPFMGWLLSISSSGSQIGIADYKNAFFVIIALMILALVLCLFFIKETFCRSTKDSIKLLVD